MAGKVKSAPRRHRKSKSAKKSVRKPKASKKASKKPTKRRVKRSASKKSKKGSKRRVKRTAPKRKRLSQKQRDQKFLRQIRSEKARVEKKLGHKVNADKVEKVMMSLHKSACRFERKKDACNTRRHCSWSPKLRKCRHVAPHKSVEKIPQFLFQ